MTPRVLVTGASGFAGGHLLAALGSADSVTAWTGRDTDALASGAGGPAWRTVDLLDRQAVVRQVAAARPDTVFHLAAAAQVGASWRTAGHTLAVNVRGTHHLLEAIREHAPGARVVVIGSATVYRSSPAALNEEAPLGPASPYAVSKLAQEELALRAARAEGLDAVVARPFNHTGPGQPPEYIAASVARQIALIEAGRQAPRILVGNLAAERDLSDVRDVVRAYVLLAERGAAGAVYNVCQGRALKMQDLVNALIARSRARIEVAIDAQRLRPVDTPVLLGSYERLAERTGWHPQIPFDRTLDDLLAWWRTRVASEPQSPV